MQQTLSVLQTLRSRECSTAAANRSASAALPGDEPRTARAVQADRRPGLAGDGAELGDGGAGAASHGEREAAVVEQRPAGRPGRRAHERDRARGEAGFGERRREGLADDRLGRAEGVGADAHDDRVAGPHDAGGVGEHVGAPLEHERDDPERCPAGGDRPAAVVDVLDLLVARGRRVAPRAEAGDHVGAHPVRQHEPGRRAAGGRGRRDVGVVGGPDRRDDVVVGEAPGERLEERRDLLVGAAPPGRRTRSTASSTAAAAAACWAAGTCSRSPVSWTTISRSPAVKAAARAAGTAVTRLPPNTIGWPGCSDVSSATACGTATSAPTAGKRRWRRAPSGGRPAQ